MKKSAQVAQIFQRLKGFMSFQESEIKKLKSGI